MLPEFIAPTDVDQADMQKSARVHRSALLDEVARMLTDSLLRQARDARNAQGLSQEELAQRVGKTQRSVSQLENGIHTPMLDTYVAQILALGGQITVDFPDQGSAE